MRTTLKRRRWSVISLRVLADALAARGWDIAPFLAGAGLAPDVLDDTRRLIAATDELAVIAAVLDDLGDPPGFGLEVGRRYRVAAYGVWGFALLASPTLRGALLLGLEYQDLTFSLMAIDVVSVEAEDAVVFDDRTVPAALRRFMIERDIAACRQIVTDLWGAPLPCRSASFRFPAPADPAAYAAALECPVVFDAAQNALHYDHQVLDRPLPQANPAVAALHIEACHARLRQIRGEDEFVEKVAAVALADPGHFPPLDAVAEKLGLSERTLRRKLADSGLGYRDLIARLRQDLACEMLRTTGLSVEAVAERLGYAETASFTHAFRRWTGQAPSRFARGAR
ncbi:AraC family transcriptional regulator [Zavarzinia sp.]|uniref:AraC family transcriptional regulator n=1 Tax=Zavarzinia sp. TaxID=2027920 RepID=UPI003565CD7E